MVNFTVIDIETNDLKSPSKVHCIVLRNSTGFKVIDNFYPKELEYLNEIFRTVPIVGHNAIEYDFPILASLLNVYCPKRFFDTLVLSRLFRQGLINEGGHSLEAWGTRLDIPKLGGDIEDYSRYTPELKNRCIRDTKITYRLFEVLKERLGIVV